MPLSWDPQAFSQEVVPGVSQAVQGIASVLLADRAAARDERLRRRAESRQDAERAAAVLEKQRDIERAERTRKDIEAAQRSRMLEEMNLRKMQASEDAAREFENKRQLDAMRAQLDIETADKKRSAEAAHWREVNAALGRLDPQGQPLTFDPRIADQSALAEARAEAAKAQASLAGTRASGAQKPPTPFNSTQVQQINDDLRLRALKAGVLEIDPVSKQPVIVDQAGYDQMRDSAFMQAGAHPDNLMPLGPENPYRPRNWTNAIPGAAAPQASAVAPQPTLEDADTAMSGAAPKRKFAFDAGAETAQTSAAMRTEYPKIEALVQAGNDAEAQRMLRALPVTPLVRAQLARHLKMLAEQRGAGDPFAGLAIQPDLAGY